MKFSSFLLKLNFFALQAYLIRFSFGPYPSNLQELLIASLGIVFLAEYFLSGRTKVHFKRHWLLMCLLGLTALSTGIAALNETLISNLDFIRHLKFLFFGGALAFLFLEICQSQEEKKSALMWGAYGALSFGLFSLAYNLLGFNVAYDFRLLGPLDSAVYLATYLSPFLILLSMEATKNKKYLLPAGLLFALLLATRSLGAIAAYFLVMVAFLLLQDGQKLFKKKGVKPALFICCAVLLIAIFYMKVLPSIQSESSSLNERGQIWATALHLLESPSTLVFGVGPSQFEAHYIAAVDEVLGHSPLDYNVIQPHNIFFLFHFHYGFLGDALLIYLLFLSFKRLKNPSALTPLQLYAILVLIYFFIHGQLDTPWLKNDILPLLIIFGAIAFEEPKHEA